MCAVIEKGKEEEKKFACNFPAISLFRTHAYELVCVRGSVCVWVCVCGESVCAHTCMFAQFT